MPSNTLKSSFAKNCSEKLSLRIGVCSPSGFLMFSGGIEKQHRDVMG